MVLLKEKCGKMHPDILVTGEIIVKKVLAFSFIRMVINMKACGLWIKNMGRELIGGVKVQNYEENIQEIGLKIKNTVEVHSFLKIVIVMMDIG
jgi:hypothetical protein